MSPEYITGAEAIDLARMTGLPLRSVVHRSWEPSDIAPAAVASPRAADRVYLDVGRLDWWDRWRLAWTRIGAHFFLDCQTN